jgi:hypothetical protein
VNALVCCRGSLLNRSHRLLPSPFGAPNTSRTSDRGRPTLYTAELALEICTRLADGEPLKTICAAEGMPDRSTVFDWRHRHPEFQTMFATARIDAGDVWADRAVAVAMTADPVTAAAVRVKYDAVRWYASKLAPKIYGDRLQHTGADGGAITMIIETGVRRSDDDDAAATD